MAQQWFKFYGGEYLSDPKMGSLSPDERSCWVTILCLASAASTEGMIEYLTVEVLLEKSGIHFDPYYSDNWDKMLGILAKFERMNMIKKHENGTVEVLNWEKRQEKFMTPAERAKVYRDKKKNVTQSDENVHVDVTNVTLEKSREEKRRVYTQGFESFWESYPPTRKQDKPKCFSKWQTLLASEPGLEEMILKDTAIRSKMHTDWVKEDGRFVPAPLVYLNNRRWESPIIGAPAGKETIRI